ncbi:MAG: hypothetical protein N2204_02185 [Anaerolineae bacterium]|nr:hypothetical protein [Anaerolineae bacterium]
MTDLLLAGWRVRLHCAPDALARAAAARYAAFKASEDGPTDLTIQVVARPAASKSAGAAHLLEAALAADTAGYRLEATGVVAHVQLAQGQASLTLSDDEPLAALEYFLRIACALLAFHKGGLLVHAAGLLADDYAYLFTGVSGSGKSTVTALSPHAIALSDDLVLLRPAGGRWIAHSTPFWNPETAARAGQTASGPVAGIYKLVKAREVRLEPLSPAAAAAELAANCPVINGRPELLPELLSRCRALVGAVPTHQLYFRKDASFWKLISGGAN